jgi:hypothetical protein
MLDVVIGQHMVRIGTRFAVSFQRTLRIPDDGRSYPLPPGLGVLPINEVRRYADRVPSIWRERGGLFIPMYQREALWLAFEAASWRPNAVKIAVGQINAVSGQPYDHRLRADPQDYIVCPDQPWLDGINAGDGTIRQFVAMPLGLGYTVEAAVRGVEEFGGIQITAFEPKPGLFPEEPPNRHEVDEVRHAVPQLGAPSSPEMGIGAGGLMKQKIYRDAYGVDTWDEHRHGSIVVHIVNSAQFTQITGREPPPTPIDARTYTEYGLPWFDLYDEAREHVPESARLANVKTITARDRELDVGAADSESFPVPESQRVKLGDEEAE